MKLKVWLIEALVLVAVFAATILGICYIMMKLLDNVSLSMNVSSLLSARLEISLQDTYLILSGWQAWIPFSALATITYFIREAFYGYKRRFQNLILITCNLLLLIQLIGVIRLAYIFSLKGGWTIYPPLSALPQPSAQIPNAPSGGWFVFCSIILFFILTLMFGTFLAGKSWNYKKS